MKPTKFDQVVHFLKRSGTTDADGNFAPGVWQDHATMLVATEFRFARELVSQGRLHDKNDGVLKTWNTPEARSIDATMKVEFDAGPWQGKTAAVRGVVIEDAHEVAIIITMGEEP
jgi:hypothetical protein